MTEPLRIKYLTGYFMTWRVGSVPYFTSKDMAKTYNKPEDAESVIEQMRSLGYDVSEVRITSE